MSHTARTRMATMAFFWLGKGISPLLEKVLLVK